MPCKFKFPSKPFITYSVTMHKALGLFSTEERKRRKKEWEREERRGGESPVRSTLYILDI